MKKKTDLAVNRRRKATSGAATAYMSRNQALKKLQLRLADFRRICILKGIYPHEPRHPKKAAGATGSTAPKTYYYAKDIQFLLHEPIVVKFREYKIFARKLHRAIGRGEYASADRLRENKPRYSLDHIVRERYPTFTDAIRDLSDCLSLCFLFATLPSSRRTQGVQVSLCRRLTVEFMLYVISTKSLRKVFVSIKGVYYEAEICDQKVNWVVPHPRAYDRPVDVDFRIMSTFVEFYATLLGFVNFKLFASVGLHYPPVLASAMSVGDDGIEQDDRVASLTLPLKATTTEADDGDAVDAFPPSDDALLEQQKAVQAELKSLQSLFSGFKFFLQRETPRESLTFVICSCGGEVSWDRSLGPGCTYQEDDERITHQIIDRGQRTHEHTTYVSRCYIQPQWVFDSVNARRLQPVEKYFPGVALPPHLSPFVEEKEGEYVPPEKRRLLGEDVDVMDPQDIKSEPEDESMEEEDDEDDEKNEDDDDSSNADSANSSDAESEEGSDDEESADEGVEHVNNNQLTKPSSKASSDGSTRKPKGVTVGSVEKTSSIQVRDQAEREERKLAEMMIPKKRQRLFRKIMHAKKKTTHEAKVLAAKREAYDQQLKKTARKKKL